ncbi:MAG: hypothetical protein ACREEW_15290 [Caulobacteraceae bacterium]
MTVCTASMFFWINDAAARDYSPAIVAASDRKLTDSGLGIGYESSRYKGTTIGTHRLALVSGDLTVHASIANDLGKNTSSDNFSTKEIASEAGRLLGEYRIQEATKIYLAPLGLNSDLFISRQREMEPSSVARLIKQIQDYEIDAEILIAGVDDGKDASIYRVDSRGIVSNHTSIGFLSIGSGGIHSSAYFMTLPYRHATTYYMALYHTYAAKRRAEVDPYVGKLTDMFVTTAHGGTSQIPQEVMSVLEKLYERSLDRERKIAKVADKRLMDLHEGIWAQPAQADTQAIREATSSKDQT